MGDPGDGGARAFPDTQWSLVVAARPGEASRTRARKALEQLCRSYWFPLYAFVRGRGRSPEDAQDLTQAFFARILETDGLAAADPKRGRFRSYLLGAMKHFLANEWHRGRARKRGGGVTILDLDALAPEARYALEPAQGADPEAAFDREWAQEVIERALERLRAEAEPRGKGPLIEVMRAGLAGDEPPRQETAARLGMTEGALKVALHRLRRQFREALRCVVAETVDDPSEVDDEIRHLIGALREGLAGHGPSRGL